MRLHGAPARGKCLGLGAEPALAFVGLDLDLGVPGAPGHVIDAAIAGDIALDGAALGRLLLDRGPALGAELPGRHRLALPDAEAFRFGQRLLLHVAGGVSDEGPGIALAHHLRIDVAAVDEAHRQRAPVLIEPARLAANGLAAVHVGERSRCRGPARPPAEPFAPAGLRRLRGIDTLEAGARLPRGDGVA